MASQSLKCVFTAANAAEAGFMADELERRGISVQVRDNDLLSTGTGPRLFVRHEDYDRTLRVLKLFEEQASRESGKTPSTATSSWSVAAFMLGVCLGATAVLAVYESGLRQPSQPNYEGEHGWDTDNDGRQDTWAVYTNGELSERRVDANRDGKPDNWEFYENSRLVRSLHDANSDGEVDQWATYDASEQAHRSERDLNRDGKVDSWETFRYGVLSEGEYDVDYDGKADEWTTLDDGQVVERRWSLDGSGTVHRKARYEHGIIVREQIDRDSDGSFETLLEYDRFGRRNGGGDDAKQGQPAPVAAQVEPAGPGVRSNAPTQ